MRRPRGLVDCDGVLSNFTKKAVAVVNEIFGTSYTEEDVTQFDFCKALGLSSDAAATVKREIAKRTGFAIGLDVYPGAVEGIHRLRQYADIFIVTSPWNSNQTWTFERERWLHRNFQIPSSNVIHCGAKFVCAGDFLIDDKMSHLDEWRAEYPLGLPIHWKTPHNSDEEWDGLSCSTWDEVIEAVTR